MDGGIPSVRLEFTPDGILAAYQYGLFPMYHEAENEILWFLPERRAIMPLNGFHTSRSLQKRLRRRDFDITFNQKFTDVMRCCADRPEGSWISDEFVQVYSQLHQMGFAHSVEVNINERLVGGAYGVALGGAFMAESMFHRETDASKIALYFLVERLRVRGFQLMDVQYLTDHLHSLGVIEVSRQQYQMDLQAALRHRCTFA